MITSSVHAISVHACAKNAPIRGLHPARGDWLGQPRLNRAFCSLGNTGADRAAAVFGDGSLKTIIDRGNSSGVSGRGSEDEGYLCFAHDAVLNGVQCVRGALKNHEEWSHM